MRALSSIPVLLAVALAGTACDNSPAGPSGPQNPAALLVVAPTAATIKGGGRLQLNLSAHDADGISSRPTNVTWTSSNPTVASVSPDGVVTGHLTGASQITAWWSGVRGLSTITVISDTVIKKKDPPAKKPCADGPADPFLKIQTLCVAK